jgi:hypothetical protein
MKCQHAAKYLSAYVDGQLGAAERQAVALHLAGCPDCSSGAEKLLQLRRSLRSLPKPVPPVDLGFRLRVLASRERARLAGRATLANAIARWWSHVNVWLDNLMYPMALPVAGGLASALMLFAVLATGVVPPQPMDGDDVPTPLYTGASIRSTGPMDFTDADIEVELLVDGQGKIVDYTLPQSVMDNHALRRAVEKNLLTTRFNPATAFGLPTPGRVKVSFRKSHIEVKG